MDGETSGSLWWEVLPLAPGQVSIELQSCTLCSDMTRWKSWAKQSWILRWLLSHPLWGSEQTSPLGPAMPVEKTVSPAPYPTICHRPSTSQHKSVNIHRARSRLLLPWSQGGEGTGWSPLLLTKHPHGSALRETTQVGPEATCSWCCRGAVAFPTAKVQRGDLLWRAMQPPSWWNPGLAEVSGRTPLDVHQPKVLPRL